MKLVFAAAAVAIVFALAAPTARAQSNLTAPPPDPSIAWCRDASKASPIALQIPGIGQALAKCMEGHHMRRDVRNCLIATGITLARRGRRCHRRHGGARHRRRHGVDGHGGLCRPHHRDIGLRPGAACTPSLSECLCSPA